MTDAEIIKAFEICYVSDEDCSGCPFCDEDGECTDIGDSNLSQDVFDLINRQKAEIERLKTLAFERHLHIQHLNAVIRELKETRYSQVKAEAYKDLAEKLKAKKQRFFSENDGFVECVLAEDVDKILGEVST